MAERIAWTTHNGRPVLRIDYSGLRGPELLPVIRRVPPFYKDVAHESVLCFVDVRKAFADNEVMEALKAVVKETKVYHKKVAVVGIEGVKSVLLMAVNLFSGLGMKPFADEKQALDWPVS